MAASKQTVINWMLERVGKVFYSNQPDKRLGPDYYDESSAVFSALIAGGYLPQHHKIGYIKDLYALEGSLLIPINYLQVSLGDVFISGSRNCSSTNHAGIAVNKFQIVHCSPKYQGMVKTWTLTNTGFPVHWYRLAEPSEDLRFQKSKLMTVAYS